MATNPRYAKRTLRERYRARFKAMQCPCAICNGRFGPIHYDEPSDGKHPLSFVIDEIIPISKAEQFGYPSKEAAAQDWDNLQASHYICNARKGARLNYKIKSTTKLSEKNFPNISDGEW